MKIQLYPGQLLWCQNEMPTVICSRPEFKQGLCQSSHNYITVSVLSITLHVTYVQSLAPED